MSKRPVAFRVPHLCGDTVSYYFVTTSEDEARAMADTNQVEYEGLYLVGDRFPAPAQAAPKRFLMQRDTAAYPDLNDAAHSEPEPLAAPVETVTKSSGCVFCDIGVQLRHDDITGFHHVAEGETVPCSLSRSSAETVEVPPEGMDCVRNHRIVCPGSDSDECCLNDDR